MRPAAKALESESAPCRVRFPPRRTDATAFRRPRRSGTHPHPMSTKKTVTKKSAAKARDLNPKKNPKGGPAYMKLGDIKGEFTSSSTRGG